MEQALHRRLEIDPRLGLGDFSSAHVLIELLQVDLRRLVVVLGGHVGVLLAQVVRTITYCPKENDPGPANMVAFVRRAIPYEKAHRNGGPPITDFYSMANGYDLLSAIKQAIEANGGKTDGPTIAKWVIEHPEDLKLLSIKQSKATSQTHFMFDPSNFVVRQFFNFG